MTTQPDESTGPAEPTCCGEKYAGGRDPKKVGAPLIPACKLCPKSPTWWRRAEAAQQV